MTDEKKPDGDRFKTRVSNFGLMLCFAGLICATGPYALYIRRWMIVEEDAKFPDFIPLRWAIALFIMGIVTVLMDESYYRWIQKRKNKKHQEK